VSSITFLTSMQVFFLPSLVSHNMYGGGRFNRLEGEHSINTVDKGCNGVDRDKLKILKFWCEWRRKSNNEKNKNRTNFKGVGDDLRLLKSNLHKWQETYLFRFF
jgi:hypothetical protein